MVDQLITAGAAGAVIAGIITLVRIAVSSERRRADDARESAAEWRDAAETLRAANDVLAVHVGKLVGSVEQLSTTQREMMGLLRVVVDRDVR